MTPPHRVDPGKADRLPFFEPWIGDRARGDFGVRWHVMGDSHYVVEGPDAYPVTPDLTCHVVRDWASQRSSGSAFFTRVAAMVLDRTPGSFELADAWRTFAFSNFAQQVLDRPRLSPSSIAWAEARECFFGQLAHTRPEILIVLGDRAWQQLPDDHCVRIPPFRVDAGPEWPRIDDAWLYLHEVDRQVVATVAIPVVHPSAWGKWNWQTAARRVHSAMRCRAHVLDGYAGGAGRA